MKKLAVIMLLLGVILGNALLWGKTEKVKCSSSVVTLSFKNVKLKKIKFTNDSDIKYEVNSDSFNVKVKIDHDKIKFISKMPKNEAKISLYLPKNKTYQTFIENNKLCKFDQNSITAQITDDQRIVMKDGSVKVYDAENNNIISIGDEGIYVNNEDQLVKISDEGIFIKDDDDDIKDYHGFWAKLLAKTITGFAGFITDLSLRDIGKNITKIINQQNFKGISKQMGALSITGHISSDMYKKEISKSLKIKKKKELSIDNFNGSVIINKSNSDTLKIKIVKYSQKEKYLKKIKVKIINENKKIVIKSYKEDQLIEGGVKLTISCPENISLTDIKTANGDISVTNGKGKLNAITTNGDISVENFSGNVGALTANGDIFAKNITGKTNLVTSNGKIDGRNIADLTTAKSSNGKINLKRIKLLSDVKSSNSNIYLEVNDILTNSEIISSNGKITLIIPQNINLTIEAKTSNGDVITSNLAFNKSNSSGNYFKGILGNGKNKVLLITSNSNIIIKKK